jgi:6-phosphofructokinase
LGHLRRGGAPTSFNRVLATRFGGQARRKPFDGLPPAADGQGPSATFGDAQA